MTLLSSHMLYALGLLVPLVAVYLLKVRPRKKLTPAWFLWQGILQEKQQSALLRRLRDWLSLLLMALATCLLVLAMADPIWNDSASQKDLLILIDTGASMNATHQGKSRIDDAKDRAMMVVRSLPVGRRAAVVTVDSLLSFRVPMTIDKKLLLQGIDSIRASHCPLNQNVLNELLNVPDAFAALRCVFFTDGVGLSLYGEQRLAGWKGQASPEIYKVGESGDNIGIVDFDVCRLPSGNGRVGIFFRCFSNAKEPKEIRAVLSCQSQESVVRVFPLTVAAGENAPEQTVIDGVDLSRDSKWFLRLECDDALALDNYACAALAGTESIRVACAADHGSVFIRNCVQAFSSQQQPLVLSDQSSSANTIGADVVVCGHEDEAAEDAHLILLGPCRRSSAFWGEVKGTEDTATVPSAKVLVPQHPAVRFCNPEAMLFCGARRLKLPESSVVLIASNDGVPLVAEVYARGQKAYVLNFDPEASQFYLSAGFPILLYAMACDLCDKSPQRLTAFRTGQRLSDLLPAESADASVRSAVAGTSELKLLPLWMEDERDAFVPDVYSIAGSEDLPLSTCGFYLQKRFRENDDKSVEIVRAVSLLDETTTGLESDSLKKATFSLDSGSLPRVLLVVLGILLMVAESILYHRRKVG